MTGDVEPAETLNGSRGALAAECERLAEELVAALEARDAAQAEIGRLTAERDELRASVSEWRGRANGFRSRVRQLERELDAAGKGASQAAKGGRRRADLVREPCYRCARVVSVAPADAAPFARGRDQ